MQDILGRVNTDIHLMRSECTVRRELQHRFLEIEIASVTQNSRDTLALFVQLLRGELLAGFDDTAVTLRDETDGVVGDIDRVVAHVIRLVGGHKIGQVHFAVLDLLDRVHFGIEIT